jgi:hypothetical protein
MRKTDVRLAVLLVAVLIPSAAARSEEPRRQVALPRTAQPIAIDGDLLDPGWKDAAVLDEFFETSPGDNLPAKAKTTARVVYDDKAFYIAVECEDPEPARIRAPFVDRDNVIGTDDNIAIFLDTRNDGRSALEFRVNPRGIQGDASWNDATGTEDFSPDLFYDSAARLTATGWTAELRIPFSSLRYPKADPQSWGILIWRNYPRDFRYAFHSSRLPRGSNCLICHSLELTGIGGLPGGGHVIAAPYVTAEERGHRVDPDDLGSRFVNDPISADAGLDVKWTPGANTVVDATLNPDFSQVESDVPQLSVNNRFALFYPEKRPFFLEGVDLFETPIQAVYTRTITSPRWGGRVTGKLGSSAYTVLVAEDRGGGSVILPGPQFSDFAPQDDRSLVTLARLRQDFGTSFGGLLLTDREIRGGGHHRVFGPDFQWRPNDAEQVTAQVLLSDSATPDMNGRRVRDHALNVSWSHQKERYDWFVAYKDFGNGFRADEGFVFQSGFRQGQASAALRSYPKGIFSYIRAYAGLDYIADRDDRLVSRSTFLGATILGVKNLQANVEAHVAERTRVGEDDPGAAPVEHVAAYTFVNYFVQIDPSRRFSRFGLQGAAGESLDVTNSFFGPVRVGSGATISPFATVRPTDRLELTLNASLQWLDVTPDAGERGRLFTATIGRVRAVYFFSARAFLRVIGQYVRTKRDPALYRVAVDERDGSFLGSALFSYKLNWQTVLFLGYGDERVLTAQNDLVRSSRQVFLKVSYAFQR